MNAIGSNLCFLNLELQRVPAYVHHVADAIPQRLRNPLLACHGISR